MQKLCEDVLALPFPLIIACLLVVRCHGGFLSCDRRTCAEAVDQRASRAWVNLMFGVVDPSGLRCACEMNRARGRHQSCGEY